MLAMMLADVTSAGADVVGDRVAELSRPPSPFPEVVLQLSLGLDQDVGPKLEHS
jgi:hypothetical protein